MQWYNAWQTKYTTIIINLLLATSTKVTLTLYVELGHNVSATNSVTWLFSVC